MLVQDLPAPEAACQVLLGASLVMHSLQLPGLEEEVVLSSALPPLPSAVQGVGGGGKRVAR